MKKISDYILTLVQTILAVLVLLSPLAIADDDTLSPFVQELLLSNSGDNQEAGEWQWLLSGQYNELNDVNQSALISELEYGVSDQLTFGIELPFYRFNQHQHKQGFGNIEVSALYRVAEFDDSFLSIAVEKSFATASSQIRETQEQGWEFELIYFKQLADNQFKGSFIREIEDDESANQIAFAWLRNFGDFSNSLELTWYQSAEFGADQDDDLIEQEREAWQLAVSVLWHYNHGQELQLAVPVGLSGDVPDWGLALNWLIEWE